MIRVKTKYQYVMPSRREAAREVDQLMLRTAWFKLADKERYSQSLPQFGKPRGSTHTLL